MFCITLALKDNPVVWTLLYKTEEAATTHFKFYQDCQPDSSIGLGDDFGQTCDVKKSCVAGAMLEDLDKSMMAHVERGLHNARTQARAQQLAANDPVLKTAAMSRGPAMFDPTMQNGMHRG